MVVDELLSYQPWQNVVTVKRWSCSRGAACVVEYAMGRLREWSL